MPTTRPPHPAEFMQRMVELVRAGRTPAELGRYRPDGNPLRTVLMLMLWNQPDTALPDFR